AEISGLTRELGVTTLYVTHDQAEALTMADRVAILRKGVLQDVGTPTQVYGRPATLYVAAFLGSPRMNLLEAQVYVNLDRHVALHIGDQTLYLPWNDLRARHVAQFHGERIVVGVRAEALVPVVSATEGHRAPGSVPPPGPHRPGSPRFPGPGPHSRDRRRDAHPPAPEPRRADRPSPPDPPPHRSGRRRGGGHRRSRRDRRGPG